MESQSPQERKNKILFLLGTIVLIAITLTLVIIFFARTQIPRTQIKTPQTVTPMEEINIPTPTPGLLKRSEIEFEVLNGSGINGAAAEGAKSLGNLGYDKTTTGNADKIYEASQVSFNSEIHNTHKKIIFNEIISLYPDVEFSEDITASTPAVRLIIGKE